ncbi:MAG: methylenetetrahydrofolate reductase [NAD(P)H] [Candidatus Nanopelagicales bacterium]|nr:methylenetetrahydrofolate reductase [NAD(P)H] [Candidatus Nanopelagicales bacterium]
MPSQPHETSRPSLGQILKAGERSFSFEFFPPKTDVGVERLWLALRELEALHPTFVSVTYGAGGSTRDRTIRLTERIANQATVTPVGHLTCVGASAGELRDVVAQYASAGVTNILAIRGDPPGGAGQPWLPHPGGLDHAEDLVRLIMSLGSFTVGVAAFPEGHPEAPDLEFDAQVLRRKQDAGAAFAVTQFFFDADDYFRLRERTARIGVSIPIIPGVMPVTNVAQIERFAQLSGAKFPDALAARFHAVAEDAEAVRLLGVSVATQMCEKLLSGGSPGLHFFTLNRSSATREIYSRLGLQNRFAAQAGS